MKKRNKYLSLVCVVMCLLFSLVFFVRAEAASNVNVQVVAPSELPAVGQTFQVIVDISGNPGFCAAQVNLSYDDSVVTCTKATLGDLLDGMLSATNAKAKEGAIIAAAGTTPAHGDGTLGVFTFQVVKQGDPGIKLTKAVVSGEDGETLFEVGYSSQKPSGDSGNTTPSNPSSETTEDTPKANTTVTTEETTKTVTTTESLTEESEIPTQTGSSSFADVPSDFWGADAISKAVEKKLVAGYEDNTFRPMQNVTRAEFVTMLWRLAGSPAASTTAGFKDVASDAWYAPQINWAAEKGFVNGKSANEFDPNGAVTRQEAMAILFRYDGEQSGTEGLLTSIYDDSFKDSASIADWAKPAMYWAVYKSLITGVTADILDPTGCATRAQIATILVRYADNISR